ncbi:MAG: ABC transporter permease [Peptoniphilaceae bacterium]|nr:ABC transporter permease [Peptoniphilaceae bacterium]MDY6085683.1 methionine ABC transporter permease [Peptoniphilaceae bacterium]
MDFSYAWSIRGRILQETVTTLYMASLSAVFAGLFGLILGVILVVTRKGGILELPALNGLIDKLINLLRAVPFIIMLALVVPVTLLIVQKRIGSTAAIVPLVFCAAPFFAKQVEQALSDLDPGLIEAAQAMGDSPLQIIFDVYLREGLPQLIRAASITLISLIGLTTMAGTVGGGGIGNLAISLGYNRYKDDVTLVCVAIILILVYLIQGIANRLIQKTTH